jgi:putative transposase
MSSNLSQYTELQFHPYDNSLMESFYRTIKRELIQDAQYETPEQARDDIFKYIEVTFA